MKIVECKSIFVIHKKRRHCLRAIDGLICLLIFRSSVTICEQNSTWRWHRCPVRSNNLQLLCTIHEVPVSEVNAQLRWARTLLFIFSSGETFNAWGSWNEKPNWIVLLSASRSKIDSKRTQWSFVFDRLGQSFWMAFHDSWSNRHRIRTGNLSWPNYFPSGISHEATFDHSSHCRNLFSRFHFNRWWCPRNRKVDDSKSMRRFVYRFRDIMLKHGHQLGVYEQLFWQSSASWKRPAKVLSARWITVPKKDGFWRKGNGFSCSHLLIIDVIV